MLTIDQLDRLTGGTVYGSSGDKIGSLGQIYLDDQTQRPEWVTVQTGLLGLKQSFVPLADARVEGDGIVVPYDKDKIKGAPSVDPDSGHLSATQEDELYRYYGMSAQTSGHHTDTTRTSSGGHPGTHATTDRDTTGHDTSGRTTDDAMTRSEEHLRAGTETVHTGRARLRKHVITDTEHVEVPVRREEVTLEREPITDTNRDNAYDGPTISEEEHEVVLTEERPVVQTEAVPVERVRLGKQTHTDTETVTGQVRKEHIELDDDTRSNR